jgi:hypothetical protein
MAGVFASEFQGGQFVEVLGTHGTNPLGLWKVTGPQKNLQKAYDKAVKGSVYASTGKATCPDLLSQHSADGKLRVRL